MDYAFLRWNEVFSCSLRPQIQRLTKEMQICKWIVNYSKNKVESPQHCYMYAVNVAVNSKLNIKLKSFLFPFSIELNILQLQKC